MFYINKEKMNIDFYFCPQYSWIFKMYFYCRRGLRQVPCQIPGRKYFNKRFSTEAGESKLKGGNTRTAMIKHPNGQFDIGLLRWNSKTRFTCYHGNILGSERKCGDWEDFAFIGSWSLFILLPLKTSGQQYRSWKHFDHFDVRERFINVEDAYFNIKDLETELK